MEALDSLNNLEEPIEEDNTIDIEEIEALLGLEGKSKEISDLFSTKAPNNFLEGISIITNSNKFDDISQSNQDNNNDINSYPDIKNVVINCSNFFMAENSDKFKIVFPKPVQIKEKIESINTDENKISQKNDNKKDENINNNNNNVKNNNQNSNKEDKKQKQKNKKKKKRTKKRQK